MDKARVMVVDDNKDFLQELEEILSLSGYDVVASSDALSALETACKAKPDIVLLDLKMSGKSGFRLAEEIKHFPELKNIPIIGMTGHFIDVEYSLLVHLSGMKKCLIKPFLPLDLINQIEALLRDKTKNNHDK